MKYSVSIRSGTGSGLMMIYLVDFYFILLAFTKTNFDDVIVVVLADEDNDNAYTT